MEFTFRSFDFLNYTYECMDKTTTIAMMTIYYCIQIKWLRMISSLGKKKEIKVQCAVRTNTIQSKAKQTHKLCNYQAINKYIIN